MERPKVLLACNADTNIVGMVAKSCDYEVCDENDRQAVLDGLVDADGLMLSGRQRIDSELLERAPRLKIVSNAAVGYNNFDVEEMKKRGILATHTPDVLNDTVADLIMGLMLTVGRRICELDGYMRSGGWTAPVKEELFGIDLSHKKLGIIGMGRIGEAVAKRAYAGFDMDVSYSNRHKKEGADKRYKALFLPLDRLLKSSDYIVVMTPLSESTRHMIGLAQFATMKRDAIFINASRGPVVDEAALIEALKTGKIKAAGLDVFESEPISPDNELLKMKNVVLTPHIGSATKQTRDAMARLAAENLIDGALGKRPANIIPEMQ